MGPGRSTRTKSTGSAKASTPARPARGRRAAEKEDEDPEVKSDKSDENTESEEEQKVEQKQANKPNVQKEDPPKPARGRGAKKAPVSMEEDLDDEKEAADKMSNSATSKSKEAPAMSPVKKNEGEPESVMSGKARKMASKDEDAAPVVKNEEADEEAKAEASPLREFSGTDVELSEPSPTFPEKLMELLQDGVAPDAIWWLEDEESFAIHKDLFEEKVLGKYFRGNKFTSITRNLNRCGFRRIFIKNDVTENAVAFRHAYFKKKAPGLIKLMKEEKNKEAAGGGKAGGKKGAKGKPAVSVAASPGGQMPPLGVPPWPPGAIGSVPPHAQTLQQRQQQAAYQQQWMAMMAYRQRQMAFAQMQHGCPPLGQAAMLRVQQGLPPLAEGGEKPDGAESKNPVVATPSKGPEEGNQGVEAGATPQAGFGFPPGGDPFAMHRYQIQHAQENGATPQQIQFLQQQLYMQQQQWMQQAFLAQQNAANQQAQIPPDTAEKVVGKDGDKAAGVETPTASSKAATPQTGPSATPGDPHALALQQQHIMSQQQGFGYPPYNDPFAMYRYQQQQMAMQQQHYPLRMMQPPTSPMGQQTIGAKDTPKVESAAKKLASVKKAPKPRKSKAEKEDAKDAETTKKEEEENTEKNEGSAKESEQDKANEGEEEEVQKKVAKEAPAKKATAKKVAPAKKAPKKETLAKKAPPQKPKRKEQAAAAKKEAEDTKAGPKKPTKEQTASKKVAGTAEKTEKKAKESEKKAKASPAKRNQEKAEEKPAAKKAKKAEAPAKKPQAMRSSRASSDPDPLTPAARRRSTRGK